MFELIALIRLLISGSRLDRVDEFRSRLSRLNVRFVLVVAVVVVVDDLSSLSDDCVIAAAVRFLFFGTFLNSPGRANFFLN